jgi:chaperone modulatory protein CbpM
MSDRIYYSEEQILADVHGVTRIRLRAWVEEGIIRPQQRAGEVIFDELDRARLELVCTLCDEFEVSEDALSIFTAHLDQLNALRADMTRLMQAIAEQPDDVRAAIKRALEGDRFSK